MFGVVRSSARNWRPVSSKIVPGRKVIPFSQRQLQIRTHTGKVEKLEAQNISYFKGGHRLENGSYTLHVHRKPGQHLQLEMIPDSHDLTVTLYDRKQPWNDLEWKVAYLHTWKYHSPSLTCKMNGEDTVEYHPVPRAGGSTFLVLEKAEGYEWRRMGIAFLVEDAQGDAFDLEGLEEETLIML